MLEIGPGLFHHPGYTNIDIEEKYKPDILGDFRTMTFENVSEIRCHHVLEHFGREEGIEVLKQWHSWLKPGGRLIVETPDFELMCNYFMTQPQRLWAGREMLLVAFYGSQEADWAFHRDGWYEDKFKKVLTEIGFEIELIKHKHSYHRGNTKIRYRLPNILVIANKK